MTDFYNDWSELAFKSKKPLNDLKATFIVAPRQISQARFTELVKTYLPKGDIILGISKEAFVDGFDGQPQFTMTSLADLQQIIDKVNRSSSHKIYVLSYFQRELVHIIEKLKFSRAVFVNGSWKHSFHTLPAYYALVNKGLSYELVSAFTDESETKAFEKKINSAYVAPLLKGTFSDQQLITISDEVAKASFDHTFQTGAILAKKSRSGYKTLLSGFNKVIPYQSYALLNGSSREQHFTPPNDLNHYDTIHAEMMILVEAQKQSISLKGTTLFVNLMPCPNCARTLAETDIAEIVYRNDHSDGYAVDLLSKVGKEIRRIV